MTLSVDPNSLTSPTPIQGRPGSLIADGSAQRASPTSRTSWRLDPLKRRELIAAIAEFLSRSSACALLALLLPVLVATAVAIKIDSRGPIIFRQRRVGYAGRTFLIYKFRTMTVCEDGEDLRQATTADPRITRVGYYLRILSIDELLQLLNIIKGDMAFVGPRPHAIAHDLYYSSLIPDYPLRHIVRPGLTGWAQINGCRGETETIDKMAARLKLDIWYIANCRLSLRLMVLIRTLPNLLTPIMRPMATHGIRLVTALRAAQAFTRAKKENEP